MSQICEIFCIIAFAPLRFVQSDEAIECEISDKFTNQYRIRLHFYFFCVKKKKA